MRIAFLGLGTMGRPMAENLVAAGFDLTVWNRSQRAVDALEQAGAHAAATPAAAVAQADIVVSMLADDAAVEAVLLDDGALTAMAAGTVHVNMATVSYQCARTMASHHNKAGLHYVAAPVLGRGDIAARAQLNILAAGPVEAIERTRPLLETMGRQVWPLGGAAERANIVKIQINFMLAVAIESMGEASALGEVYGVSTDDFLEIATQTLFACPAFHSYGSLIADRAYEPANMPAPLGNKDVGLALTLANDRQVPLPLAAVVRDSLNEMLANGDHHKDWVGMAEVAARRARIDRER